MIILTPDSRASAGIAADGEKAPSQPQSAYVRYFFVAMGLLFFVINGLGFVPQLVEIHAKKIPLHWFTHVHGAIMTGWLALYLGQALLALNGRLKYHRLLGVFSVVWGLIVWVTSDLVMVGAVIRDNPPEASMQFATLALGLIGTTVFAWLFIWGIRSRKTAAVHKRLILLAMLPLMSAGIDRIGWLPGIQSVYLVRFIYLDALLIPLLVYDFVTVRRIHRITLIGATCLIVSQVVVVIAADSPAWHRFAYRAITPFVERLPEISLSDAQGDPLLGDYGSKDWKMTVSRDGGKLYLQLPGLPKWELGANSDTALFLKLDNWKLNFVKDSQGRVTKVINIQPYNTWEAARLMQP